MKRTLVRFLVAVCVAWLGSAVGLRAQLPPNARVYLEQNRRFRGETKPSKVVFYYYVERGLAGFVIFSQGGHPVARAETQAPLGPMPGTGLFDVTGDNVPEVVLTYGVGAKTFGTVIYTFENRLLRQIFEWSGWKFRIVNLRGRPLLACTPLQYGSLTDLYLWTHGRFKKSNGLFPEFYAPEIAAQERILNGPGELPSQVFARACQLAAQALLYARAYDRADGLCRMALEIVRSSSRVIPAYTTETPEALDQERKEGEKEIRDILTRIGNARKQEPSRHHSSNFQG